VLPSQYVHTVILFGFFLLCSLLGSCPSFLLFSGSPFSTVLLGQRDQPLQFRVPGLLLARGRMRGSSGHAAQSLGELYPALRGERKIR